MGAYHARRYVEILGQGRDLLMSPNISPVLLSISEGAGHGDSADSRGCFEFCRSLPVPRECLSVAAVSSVRIWLCDWKKLKEIR